MTIEKNTYYDSFMDGPEHDHTDDNQTACLNRLRAAFDVLFPGRQILSSISFALGHSVDTDLMEEDDSL